MNKYVARFLMISELSEDDFRFLHNIEEKNKHLDNWYAIGSSFFRDKFSKGFYGKDVKENEKKIRNYEFEKKVKLLIWKNDIFDYCKDLYSGESKEYMYRCEYGGCDWPVAVVHRVDNLVRANFDIRVERGNLSEIKSM